MIQNPIVQMALTGFFWSLGGIFIKLVNWNSFAITGTRGLIAMIFLCLVFRRKPVFYKKDERGRVDWKATVNTLLGGLFYALTMLFFVFATKETTAANAIFLQYTSLIYLILFSPILLKEKNDRIDYLAVAGVIVGMFVLLGGGLSGGSTRGNIFALLSGVTYGFTSIFLRKQKNSHPADSLILANLLAFLMTSPFIIRSGMPDGKSICGLLILGVVQIGIACYFWSKAVTKLSAVSCEIVGMIEPVLNPVWVALGIGEVPSLNSLLGGLMILGFIVLHTCLKEAKKH